MNYTNKSNLPSHVADVLRAAHENSAYDGPANVTGSRTISVTKLIAPVQQFVLTREHAAELTMDVLDTIPSLLGQALHHLLERAGQSAPTLVSEERLTVLHDGWTISGKTDLYETDSGLLLDYKRSSAFALVFGKPEWERQLNVYSWLMRRNGHSPKALGIVFFPEGWTKYQAMRNPDYPQERVVHVPIPMWEDEKVTAFVDERLSLFRRALDGENIFCTEEERWAKPSTYAVMKPGRKTALRVFDNEAEAVSAAQMAGGMVEARPGEVKRCSSWCACAPFCKQWQSDPRRASSSEEAA